ncbi:hypothetical protein N9937_01715 [bacterium]|nr:hypothetical protein [bacterium]
MEFTENIAILTGGPSLRSSWHDGMYTLFRSVWCINKTGRDFLHDYVYYLDTPERIFGEAQRKQWPKTMKGYRDRKTMPIDGECSTTFPACFHYIMQNSREETRVFIFGWDCAGDGVVDGKPWQESRNQCERRLMAKYWQAEKVAGVSGGMQEWAREKLGFAAAPANQLIKQPPPRTRAEARAEAEGAL